MKRILFLMVYGMSSLQTVKAQLTFTAFDTLLEYAKTKALIVSNAAIRFDQAKKAKLAAVLTIPDVTGNVTLSYTNNTQLPVNLFPAEIFGGQPGTYREVQAGVQYNTNGNENIDIKLFNLKAWQNMKLYKLNLDNTIVENKISLKQFSEQVAASYFNIVSLQEQRVATLEDMASAKTILSITENKWSAGLVKQQDVNDARVNYLTTQENYHQLEFLIQQQYTTLKLFCDIPVQDSISIMHQLSPAATFQSPAIDTNWICYTGSLLKEQTALASYRQQKYALYPTLSFFQGYTTQQFNTKSKLFDNSVKWVPSSYIGLRLSLQIPSSSVVSQLSKAKYDYRVAVNNSSQQMNKAILEAAQLSLEYKKAVSLATSNSEIYTIRKDTYEKNRNRYSEGLTGLEQTIDSFNAMVLSQFNMISSQVSVISILAKIKINNTIK